MRSHATVADLDKDVWWAEFQYRKRYEVTCDTQVVVQHLLLVLVSIPQAV